MSTHNCLWLSLILGAILLSNTVGAAEKIEPRTLCPKSGSPGQTILLIDTTNPLTEKTQERLKQLLIGFQDANNKFYLLPAQELIVYHLKSQLEDLGNPWRACNPGNPKDRTWKDNLISGRYGDERKWRNFIRLIQRSLPRRAGQVTEKQSPLLESIALIIARHVPSIGVKENRKPTRLFLFSDMLQHSELLSHYKSLPEMNEFKKLTGYTDMQSDLKGVDVWIFYVHRADSKHRQTPKHFYWWTQAIELFGGHLIEQTPL